MQLEAIRLPQVAYPIQGTDAGTPILPRETSIPFGAIMPAPILPEEGAKTRDRNPNPQKPDVEEEQEASNEPQLPERFKLILGKDFASILRYLSVDQHHLLFDTVQKIKTERGVQQFKGYPEYYVQTLPKSDAIRMSYENSVFFYHTKPGNRFVGKM